MNILLVELFFEACALACAVAHEVKLCAANLAMAFDNDLVDARGAKDVYKRQPTPAP